jgi:hypothetical protein
VVNGGLPQVKHAGQDGATGLAARGRAEPGCDRGVPATQS